VTDLAAGRPNHDNIQTAYIKADLSLTLQGPDDKWEIALIGKNINDKLTTGTCANSDFGEGVAFGVPATQTTGGTTSGLGGIDQTNCFVDPGRELWIRLTVRPFGTGG
jgi:iron complex outermembrane recepter protein